MRLHWVARGATFLEGDEARREVAQARGPGLHQATVMAPTEMGAPANVPRPMIS